MHWEIWKHKILVSSGIRLAYHMKGKCINNNGNSNNNNDDDDNNNNEVITSNKLM